ncbi:MAG: hypothetical protein ACFFC9_14125 [Promethearchaeota archaeon]
MIKIFSPSFLNQFFSEIYTVLTQKDEKLTEIWLEIPEITSIKQINKHELKDFLDQFESITIRKGNYINYIVVDKILFIIESFKFLDLDIQKLSNLLDFNGFEVLIKQILIMNGYKAINNFRFTDKTDFKLKTLQKRYEIDVIGILDSHLLIIDAKQWKRKDSYSAINRAAYLQLQRALALQKNIYIFSCLIRELLGNYNSIRHKLPFKLIPIMVTLEDNSIRISENSIPLVGIYYFNSFLQELKTNLPYFNILEINKIVIQKKLL